VRTITPHLLIPYAAPPTISPFLYPHRLGNLLCTLAYSYGIGVDGCSTFVRQESEQSSSRKFAAQTWRHHTPRFRTAY
jgi:hypothetical protein